MILFIERLYFNLRIENIVYGIKKISTLFYRFFSSMSKVILMSLPKTKERVKSSIIWRVISTVETQVPFADQMGIVFGLFQVLG